MGIDGWLSEPPRLMSGGEAETDEGDGVTLGSCGGGETTEAEREGETKAVERRWEQLWYNTELMCPIKHPILQTWQIVLP